jgi:hypothetical protein
MKDENPNKPAEFDAELQILYKAQAQEAPSTELDDAIMSLAKSANQSTKSDNIVAVDNSFWRRHRWPLSSVASVMFVATLLLINQDVTQDILSDETYAPVMMQMASDVQEADFQEPVQETELQVTPGERSSRAMMSAPNVDEQHAQLQSGAHHEVTQVEMSNVAAKGASIAPVNEDVRSKIKSLSDNKSIKTMTQRDAVVSAKQAVNHLENLVKSEQWIEAEKLVLKIRKAYPQLNSEQHPQYLRWKSLSEQVIIPLPKPVSDK